jgi:hypothetical protein
LIADLDDIGYNSINRNEVEEDWSRGGV